MSRPLNLGDTVLDVFGGSGSTGIAARLCDQPTDRMTQMAADFGLDVEWGPRNAVIYELSPLGALLAEVMCNPPKPDAFRAAAAAVLDGAAEAPRGCATLSTPTGSRATSVTSSGRRRSPRKCCGTEVSLWDATVTLDPVVMAKTFACPTCGKDVAVADCARITVEQQDPVTGKPPTQRKRVPARICSPTGSAISSASARRVTIAVASQPTVTVAAVSGCPAGCWVAITQSVTLACSPSDVDAWPQLLLER